MLRPSASSCWGKCPGYISMSMYFPEKPESEAARIGTEAHEWAALAVARKGDITHEDEAMVEGALLYASEVHPDATLEQFIPINRIHPECGGTPDAFYYDTASKTLYVWDYKYGYRSVEVFENTQMVCYTAGLLDHLGLSDLETKVVITIVQPRAFHAEGPVRSWKVMAHELRHQINLLSNAARSALSGGDCKAGSHCRDCVAIGSCPAAIRYGITLFETVDKAVPTILSAEQISTLYDVVTRGQKHLEYLCSALEEELKNRIGNGEVIPGWGVKPGPSRRKWSISDEELFEYGDLMGIDLREPTKAISPAKAEALLGKEVVKEWAVSPQGSPKVVRINQQKIREVFTK